LEVAYHGIIDDLLRASALWMHLPLRPQVDVQHLDQSREPDAQISRDVTHDDAREFGARSSGAISTGSTSTDA